MVGLMAAAVQAFWLPQPSERLGAYLALWFGHKLPLLGLRWARKVNPEGYYPALMLNTIKHKLSTWARSKGRS